MSDCVKLCRDVLCLVASCFVILWFVELRVVTLSSTLAHITDRIKTKLCDVSDNFFLRSFHRDQTVTSPTMFRVEVDCLMLTLMVQLLSMEL